MKLVVYGLEDLESLGTMVQDMFSGVSSRAATVQLQQDIEGFPMDRDHGLGWLYRVVPIKDTHLLRLAWQLPSQLPLFR